eukprot:1386649-Pyramimonas_sp.AAC.1
MRCWVARLASPRAPLAALQVHPVDPLKGAARKPPERLSPGAVWGASADEAVDRGPRPAHLAVVARPPQGPVVTPTARDLLGARARRL